MLVMHMYRNEKTDVWLTVLFTKVFMWKNDMTFSIAILCTHCDKPPTPYNPNSKIFSKIGWRQSAYLFWIQGRTMMNTIQPKAHCVISLLIPFKEDVCAFLIFSYSFIGQQLLLKKFCSNRLSFWDSLLTSTAGAAPLGWIGCTG